MRFIFLSKQFNRSGYFILKELVNSGLKPIGVFLPSLNDNPALNDKSKRGLLINEYREKCLKNNIPLLRFTKSIKILAEDNGIPVYTRNSIRSKEVIDWISSLSLDLIVLGGGWPELLPVQLIKLPKIGAINTHPSLLPDFRGTDVHRWQVLHGVKKTGTTIHYIDESFDTGVILGQKEVFIDQDDTPQELFSKTAKVAGLLMVEILNKHIANYPFQINGNPQSERDNSDRYFGRWKWEDEDFMKIQWKSAKENVYRKILASTQEDYTYNGLFSFLNKKKWIFRKAKSISTIVHGSEPGTILKVNKDGLIVATNKKNEQICAFLQDKS